MGYLKPMTFKNVQRINLKVAYHGTSLSALAGIAQKGEIANAEPEDKEEDPMTSTSA